MSWEPDPGTLEQLLGMLQALADPTRADHRNALQTVESESANPTLVLHLMYVLGRMQRAVPANLRQLAGFIIKNHVFPHWNQFDDNVQAMLQSEVLHALTDDLYDIRNIAGMAILKIIVHSSPELWVGLLMQMLQLLDSQVPEHVEACVSTIRKLCEDYPHLLDSPAASKALSVIVPKLFSLFRHPSPRIRKAAVQSLNALLLFQSASLLARINDLIEGLAMLSADPDAEVRVAVCQAIISLLNWDVALLAPYLPSICEFMVNSLRDENSDVAIEACDFWLVMCSQPKAVRDHLDEYVPGVVRNTMHRMPFTPEDVAQKRADAEAEANGTKSICMHPMHRRGRKEEEEEETRWTLRRYAGHALDQIASVFNPERVLSAFLPTLQEKLSSDDVWVREGGLLAFGAVSRGCHAHMGEYLPDLYPFLLNCLRDPTPELRAIACWSLSRYMSYFVDDAQFFESLLEILLNMMLDDVPTVQEAGCFALVTMFDTAAEAVQQYLVPILQAFSIALQKYGLKNYLVLCDTIGILADTVGHELANPNYVNMFLPNIMHRFSSLTNTDTQLMPIMECITSVVQAIGVEFQHYAVGTFQRALRIINDTLIANAALDANLTDEAPVKDFTVCGLDVLAGMAQGFGESFQVVIRDDADTLLGLMFECTKDESEFVRQSAFSLLGDLTKNCPQVVLPHLPQLMRQLILNLREEYPFVCNNASWAIGEIAMKAGGEAIAPFAQEIMNALQRILFVEDLPPILAQNIAITIGRLGSVLPNVVGEYLDDLLVPWCRALTLVGHPSEKEHAFTGLIQSLHINPTALNQEEGVDNFALACASWTGVELSPEICHELTNMLHTIRNSDPGQWRVLWATMAPETQEELSTLFQL